MIRKTIVGSWVAMQLLFASVSSAQQTDPTAPPKTTQKGMVDGENDEWGSRTLTGHTFQIPTFVDTPFLTTEFSVETDLGVFTQSGHEVIDENGETAFTFDAQMAFVEERFGVAVAGWDAVQFHLDADYVALVGGNEQSVFVLGGSTSYQFNPGVRVKVARFDKVGGQLGVHGYGVIGGGIQLQPSGIMREITNEMAEIESDPERSECLANSDFACAFPGLDVLSTMKADSSNLGGGLSLNYAQTIGRTLGCQFTVGIELQGQTVSTAVLGDVQSKPVSVYLGLAPSLNLMPHAPLAGVLEYRFEHVSSSFEANEVAGISADHTESTAHHSFSAGLYYVGRRDLQLGWIASANLWNKSIEDTGVSRDEPMVAVLAAQLSMRYFF